MIVFHCKCKRPAVNSLKVENRKESTKDSVSKYCKVDRVQRHKADSRKLQGTGEFLRLSLPGLLRRSVTKAALGASVQQGLQTGGGSLSPGCSSYLKRKLPQRRVSSAGRRPLHSRWPARSQFTHTSLPAGSEAQLKVSRTQT